MNRTPCAIPLPGMLLGALLAGVPAAQDPIPQPTPEQALQKCLLRSSKHNTRVLALLHRDDDSASQAAVQALSKGRTLARQVRYEYELLPLEPEAAPQLLARWQLDDEVDVPALVVLASDGEVIARVDRAALVRDGALDHERLGAVLTEHQCEPADAEAKLRAALQEAEKTGRSVFVRFDAPW